MRRRRRRATLATLVILAYCLLLGIVIVVLLRIQITLEQSITSDSKSQLLAVPQLFGNVTHFLHLPTMDNGVYCDRSDLIYVIKSRADEFHQRIAIRDTWAKSLTGRLVFVLGRPIVDRLQVEIDIGIESRRYGDILLVDFDDTYRNLSLKSLAILRWSQHYCTSATFIFQGDSDAIVFPRQVHAFVQQLSIDNDQQQPARIYGGWCWNIARVQRYGKWQLEQRIYASAHYPLYCSGAALIMTQSVPSLLLRQLDPTAVYLHIDDAFFTGILAESAGIQRVNISGLYWRADIDALIERNGACPTQLIAVVEYKTGERMRNAWKLFREQLATCSRFYF